MPRACRPPCRPAAASRTSRSSPSRRAPGRATRRAASPTSWRATSTPSMTWWLDRPRSSATSTASTSGSTTRPSASMPTLARVEVRDHARQRNLTIGFDRLHVATGARPTRPDLPGIDLDHVRGVQTLDDAKALEDHARTSQCRSVVVVGGGYIGLEMAEAFIRWGARGDARRGLRPADGHARRRHGQSRWSARCADLGVDVRLGTEVAGLRAGQGAARRRRRAGGRPRRAGSGRHAQRRAGR